MRSTSATNAGGSVAPVEQLQERHIRVGVAGHDRGAELVAADQSDAGDPPVAHEDARHLGLAADVDAEVARGTGERLREPAHAAAHVAHTPRVAVGFAHDVVEQHVGGARHRRAAIAPMIASVASVALSCSDSNQRSRIGRAAPVRISTASPGRVTELPERAPQLSSVRRSPSRGRSRSGGVMVSVGSTTAATRSSIASYLGYRSASRLLNLAISLRVISRVRAHHQRAAVRERRERRRVAREHFEAVVVRFRSRTISVRKRLLT